MIKIQVPVSYIWICPRSACGCTGPVRCQASLRHSADHRARYCSVEVSICSHMLMDHLFSVLCIRFWPSLLMWMASRGATPSILFFQLSLSTTCTLINSVVPVSCIWIWSVIYLMISWPHKVPSQSQTQCWSPVSVLKYTHVLYQSFKSRFHAYI